MQFTDISCYIFLSITIAVSCVESNHKISNERKDIRLEKRYSRRDPILFIQNPLDGPLQKSNVIYRKASQSQRFVPPSTKYGVPRPRYKSQKPTKPRKPGKKIRLNHRPKNIVSKYWPSTNKYKKSSSKSRYGRPPKQRPKPEYPHLIKQNPYSYTAHENTGFGEPPTNYAQDYLPPKKSYGEPPVDSYGEPLKLNNEEPIQPSAPQSFQESTHNFENQNNYHQQSYPLWADTYTTFTKKQPSYLKPDTDETFLTPVPQDYDDDDFDEIDFSQLKGRRYIKKPHYAPDTIHNRPSRGYKKPHDSSEMVVGGQYAEPPPRYVPKFKPSASMFDDQEDAFVPYAFINREIGSSATNSPYVNYKHSNMAFSPQNLNDAFSIVNK